MGAFPDQSTALVEYLSGLSKNQVVLLLVGFTIVYNILLTYYRLYWHPLARFPGPKIAAATQWYEFYYDIIRAPGGQYYKKMAELHDQYGPIIRVNPHELHIRDHTFLDELFGNATRKRDKYPPSAQSFGLKLAAQSTIEHDLHRKRRSATIKMFSKRAIETAHPIFTELLAQMSHILSNAHESGEAVDMGATFLAFFTDSTLMYLFDTKGRYLHQPALAKAWKKSINFTFQTTPFSKQVPWLLPKVLTAPATLKKLLSWAQPEIGDFFAFHEFLSDLVHKHIETRGAEKDEARAGRVKPRTLLHSIDESDLPEHEKSPERLQQESFVMMLAGSETTATVMSLLLFELATNPEIHNNIRREVLDAAGDSKRLPDARVLERLPWLNGAVREALRKRSIGVARMPRVAGEEMVYNQWRIPPGTPVGVSQPDILHNEEIFPEPLEFKPERWFDPSDLELKAFVPFMKGTRSCVGIDFAFDEMHMLTALLAARFDFELYKTTWDRDLKYVRDCFVGAVDSSSKGVRVKIVGDNKRILL